MKKHTYLTSAIAIAMTSFVASTATAASCDSKCDMKAPHHMAEKSTEQTVDARPVSFVAELGYVATDLDVAGNAVKDGKEEGYSVGLGVAFNNFEAGVAYQDSDIRELKEYSLAHVMPLGSSHHDLGLRTQVTYLDMEQMVNSSMVDKEAYTLGLGLDAKLFHKVGVSFGIERIDYSHDEGKDTGAYFGVSVPVAKDLTLSVEHRKVLDQTAVKLSWAF